MWHFNMKDESRSDDESSIAKMFEELPPLVDDECIFELWVSFDIFGRQE